MRSLGGFVLLAGIGVGLFLYFPAPVDRGTTLEEATRALAQRAPVGETAIPARNLTQSTPPSRVASFASGVTLSAPKRRTQMAAAPAVAPKVETIANWQATVAPASSGALEPTDAEGRYKLVADIQQNLKRVGCYWGRINGSWNGSTREAMREFTTRTNAALPVEKPDYLLLSLLKSHNGRSCGGAGSTVAASAPATPEVLPWKATQTASAEKAAPLFKPVPTSAVTTEPLPGRMSIGGPREFPAPTNVPLVPGTPGHPSGVATAALEPSTSAPSSTPAAAPRPRPSKKMSSGGSHRRPGPGTPRYNLMLSLGGVY
jgi:hypothetical protein